MGKVPLVLVLICGALLGLVWWTHMLATHYGFHPALGRPLLTTPPLFGHAQRLYPPWSALRWTWQWGTPQARWGLGLGAGVVGLMLADMVLRPLVGGRRRARTEPPALEGHGSSVWGRAGDLARAGLTAKTGWVLGSMRSRWGRRRILRYDGEENVLVVGPQRSGKGSGPFISTLLDVVSGHTITTDVRGDTYNATAGYRQTCSRVIRFALTQPGSAKFNLLLEVRKDTHHAFFDASVLADMLVDPSGSLGVRDHWEKTAQALITCAILYEVSTRLVPQLSHIVAFWSQPGRSSESLLEEVVETAPLPQIAQLAQEVLNKAPNERSGVMSSMMTQLHLFRDPVVAANTATSDFRLSDFTRTDRWTTLYLVLSPEEEEHVRPFMRCFLRLALGRWLEMSEERHQIRLLLDEFSSYGRISFFVNHLAVLGGRGIRTMLAVQNVPQLRDTYGHADTITEHCKVRLYFAANGQTTGQEISRQSGTGTATTLEDSRRLAGWGSAAAGSLQRHEQHHARALLTDAEAMQIPPEMAVLQVAGSPTFWIEKLPFFRVKRWRRRAQIAVRGKFHG